jgi:hypothetical protein
MQKIVIATGGASFELSVEARLRMARIEGVQVYCYKQDDGDEVNRVWESDNDSYYNKIDASKVNKTTRHSSFGDTVRYLVTYEDLGDRVYEEYCESKEYKPARGFLRDDKLLVLIVGALGHDAGGEGLDPKIVEVPDDVKWEIRFYGGYGECGEYVEYVSEVHREWHAKGWKL